MKRSATVAILAAALAVMISSGIRSSFGLFQLPIVADVTDGQRELFSLSIAINSLIYGLPLAGILATRFGSRNILIGGALFYIVGMLTLSRATDPAGLYLSIGALVGLALSATTYVVVLGAVAQLVPAEKRSQSFGLITAAGSSGMFVVPPVAEFLIQTFGWRMTTVILAAASSIILILAFGLPGRSAEDKQMRAADPTDGNDEPFIKILQKAGRNGSYWCLIGGFFVCGFHVAFVGTHLPAFLSDKGLPEMGAAVLSLIGVFNLVGSYLFGWLGDRYRKKYLLSFLYGARAVAIALFIFLPITVTSAMIFASAIGFLWLATVPLTSGSIATIFGTRTLSMLYGFVFLSHQIGGFLGVWLGGRIYDTAGTYTPVWLMAIALGILAMFVHLPIREVKIQSRDREVLA